MIRYMHHIVMASLLLIVTLSACKKEKTFADGGTLQFDGTTYTLHTVRQHIYLDSVSGEQRADLAFCTPKMTFTDGKMSGTGALTIVTVACDTAQLRIGEYDVLPESHIIIVSDDKADTATTTIGPGTLAIEQSEHGQRYTFKTDKAAGNYEGKHTYFYDIDGRQIGTLLVGDSVVPLQRGDMMLWGPIFAENVNYHEFYFYSCNLRYSDAGAIKQGTVFVVGLHAAESDTLPDGNYPISRENSPNTALYGHKSNGDWGTYRIDYRSTSACDKTNMLTGTIALKCDGDTYVFDFDCADQMKNKITGNYTGGFRLFDVR